MDKNKTDERQEISRLDKHGVDRLLQRLVDFHGEPRPDIPMQLQQALTRRLPMRARAAA
jgi:hypothetical protein